MFVGWEGVGVCSYLLVSFWFTRIAANQSSLSAFLTNRVGDCFLTIGMFAVLWSQGNLERLGYSIFITHASPLVTKRNQIKQGIGSTYIHGNIHQSCFQIPYTIRRIRLMRQCIMFNFRRKYSTLFSNNSSHLSSNSSILICRSYLAGLIEGGGHIGVHNPNTKSKVYRPKIIIVFNLNDKPLAEKIFRDLQVGKVISKPKAGHVLLQILAKEEVLIIIKLINGFMRTPKIEALHRAIHWINERDNSSIPCLGLDLSPFDSNGWLAGFTDADGCFAITVYDRKKNGVFLRTSVQTYLRLEVKQNYSREVSQEQGGVSFFRIINKIAAFFTVNLYTRFRKIEDKVYYTYIALAHNSRSHNIIRNYFDRFPLYSSKYLAYKDWCRVQDLHRGSLTKEKLEEIKAIKSNFNSKRKVFDFSHLDSFQFK